MRWQLDQTSAAYQVVFAQRTVCERINSQAVALGIERLKVRNQRSITNQNTLRSVLLNLQTVQRRVTKTADQAAGSELNPLALAA